MRIFIPILSCGLIFTGCALLPSPQRGKTNPENQTEAPITRLIHTDSGRVAQANSRFVVLTFPFGRVPGAGQKLNVYRDGEKVAALKVTGPQRDIHTVADIISGEVRVNDEVRVD